MFTFDTETCGYQGPTVLIQYQWDDDPILLHEVWHEPIIDTLMLIEEMANHEGGVVGFNLAYDWFHICQTYTTLLELLNRGIKSQSKPLDYILEYAEAEPIARDGPCVKPITACDLMLHARKGPYQTTMDRSDVRLKRIPKQLAFVLSKELERRIPLKDIYFERRANKTAPKWQIYSIKNTKTGREDPDFVDIVLKFAPSSALKAICIDAGIRDADTRLLFHDVEVDNKPLELAYAPFALALSDASKDWECRIGKKKGQAWPGVIEDHIDHWRYDSYAREYATDDVVDTRNLYKYFGEPELGDNDSILACMVGASRWRGFPVDLNQMRSLETFERKKIEKAPKAPHHVYIYLTEVMADVEKEALTDREGRTSTKRVILETIEKWKKEDKDGRITRHPAAIRATEVLEARKGHNKATLFSKIIRAGRLHPSATVIGSLSSRMSGRTEVGDGKRASSINAMGIQRDKTIRRCFLFAHEGEILNGGDFDAFEVSIADAKYNDSYLREQLCTCWKCHHVATPDEYRRGVCPGCGYGDEPFRKIHALFAMELFPGNDYDAIAKSKGTDDDMYDIGKRGFFGGCLYGGDENTLKDRLGIDLEIGRAARERFFMKYKGIHQAQLGIFNKFCSMRQPGGVGSRVIWHDPADCIKSLNNFPRYFTLENQIVKALFTLAENPPKAWLQLNLRVVRRDRVQQAGNAVRSALFAAAFTVQAQNMRAATNHEIQSTGAIETKDLQCRIWTFQPSGVHKWMVQPFNAHDEVMAPSVPELMGPIEKTVIDFVEERKTLIPLLKMDWKSNMKNWAEK